MGPWDEVRVTELATGREWIFMCNRAVTRPGLELTDKQLARRGVPREGDGARVGGE